MCIGSSCHAVKDTDDVPFGSDYNMSAKCKWIDSTNNAIVTLSQRLATSTSA